MPATPPTSSPSSSSSPDPCSAPTACKTTSASKRKRATSSASPPPSVPQPRAQHKHAPPAWLNTNLPPSTQHLTEEERSATNSPRTAVSQRLEELKLKGYLPETDTASPIACTDSILDGPSPRQLKRPTTPPSPISPPQLTREPPTTPKRRRRAKSPPLARSTVQPGSIASPSAHDQAYWWHDDEITGHLMSAPDDDGTGMNGVGFRPTAQQEAARALRRRQQLRDWRERETREARGRRAERRWNRGGGSGLASPASPFPSAADGMFKGEDVGAADEPDTPTKVVRFA